jgi:hypothetical protein
VARNWVFADTDDQTLAAGPRFDSSQGSGLVECSDEANGKLPWQSAVPQRMLIPAHPTASIRRMPA